MPMRVQRYSRGIRRGIARAKQQRFRRRHYARRTKNYSSNSTGGAALRFKKKRFRPRSYLRNAYKASEEQTKYRSFGTGTINTTIPTALGTCVVENIQAIPDNFMLTTGGLVLGVGSTVTADDSWAPKLFVRGGTATISFTNRLANATNVRIKLWMCRGRNVDPARVNTQYTFTGVASTFDPTTEFTWYQSITAPFFSSEKILEVGDSWTTEQRIKPFGHNQWQTQQTDYLSHMPWWIWSIEPCQVAAAAVVDIVYGHNLSFTGDMNNEAY